jgi:hypothetical protein
MDRTDSGAERPDLYLFNPFAEAFWAKGKAFTPTQSQKNLSHDLESLPRFLAFAKDIVLVSEQPSSEFQATLSNAGFNSPEFIEFPMSGIPAQHPLRGRALRQLRPWAWGPDSEALLKPLFGNASIAPPSMTAELYSKTWSAQFLREEIQCRSRSELICTEYEIGIVVNDFDEAMECIRQIRSRGHLRVVVKQPLGLAGHNALRLWEPELLPEQRRWIERSLEHGSVLVEPWLERLLDFSVQLEMNQAGLRLLGYTGLRNDLRGQYQANWAEPGFQARPPAQVFALLGVGQNAIDEVFFPLIGRLEKALRIRNYVGPIGIDTFIYRQERENRLKPVVEFNPRFTMGRLMIELMQRVAPERFGEFRLVPLKMARAKGCQTLAAFAEKITLDSPLVQKSEQIRGGSLCLNDPKQARTTLAILRVAPDRESLG